MRRRTRSFGKVAIARNLRSHGWAPRKELVAAAMASLLATSGLEAKARTLSLRAPGNFLSRGLFNLRAKARLGGRRAGAKPFETRTIFVLTCFTNCNITIAIR